jgi:hypothetical protein
VRPLDTSEEAAAIHEELLSSMGAEGRFRLAMQMSNLTREFTKAGIRDRHPEYDEAQVLRELTKILYGR